MNTADFNLSQLDSNIPSFYINTEFSALTLHTLQVPINSRTFLRPPWGTSLPGNKELAGIPEQTQTQRKTVQDQNGNGDTAVGAQRPGQRVTARRRTANIFIRDYGLVSNSPQSRMTPRASDTQDKACCAPLCQKQCTSSLGTAVSRVIAPEDVAVLVPGAVPRSPTKETLKMSLRLRTLRECILGYPGGTQLVTRVLRRDRGKQKSRSERRDART